jgi:outer membrane protein OmpA-like peptidoglycan-associated protein
LKRFCFLPVIAVLAACAHQGVGLPQASPESPAVNVSPDYVGLGVESLPAKAVGEYMTTAFSTLNKALAECEAKQWQLTQLNDGSIRLQSATAAAFETDSAELRPSALDALSRIAKVTKTFNKTTVHILANGRNVSAAAFSQSLSDRRAAALATFLNVQGVDGTRTRYEGSANAQSGTVQILIKPIVMGAEPQAWMSPS